VPANGPGVDLDAGKARAAGFLVGGALVQSLPAQGWILAARPRLVGFRGEPGEAARLTLGVSDGLVATLPTGRSLDAQGILDHQREGNRSAEGAPTCEDGYR
jgi:hypothetical protein